jgi:hypothetical protein
MLGDNALTFREFLMREPVPLATIHQAVMEFLVGREDAVLFGAQAVNAYVDEPRMTQDVDILSPRAHELAGELQEHLRRRFHIAVRIREIGEGRGYRLYQVQKPKNRHLVDLRPVQALPPAQRVANVLVLAPAELVAMKLIAYSRRLGTPKSGTDWRDLAMLLLTFPELKSSLGPVRDRLEAEGVAPSVLSAWDGLAAQQIRPASEDEDF